MAKSKNYYRLMEIAAKHGAVKPEAAARPAADPVLQTEGAPSAYERAKSILADEGDDNVVRFETDPAISNAGAIKALAAKLPELTRDRIEADADRIAGYEMDDTLSREQILAYQAVHLGLLTTAVAEREILAETETATSQLAFGAFERGFDEELAKSGAAIDPQTRAILFAMMSGLAAEASKFRSQAPGGVAVAVAKDDPGFFRRTWDRLVTFVKSSYESVKRGFDSTMEWARRVGGRILETVAAFGWATLGSVAIAVLLLVATVLGIANVIVGAMVDLGRYVVRLFRAAFESGKPKAEVTVEVAAAA